MRSEAYFSNDRQFRYWLTRIWDESLPIYCVIGCNPSTADETIDDPTIRRVIGFGQRLGYGGALMLNVGAYRATDPKKWAAARDPFGPENRVSDLKVYISDFCPAIVVAAWGKPCVSNRLGSERSQSIKCRITGMKCWGRNSDRSPRHPLMLPYSTMLEDYS